MDVVKERGEYGGTKRLVHNRIKWRAAMKRHAKWQNTK